MALAVQQLIWLLGGSFAILIIVISLLIWLYINREGKK